MEQTRKLLRRGVVVWTRGGGLDRAEGEERSGNML